jgi:NADH-quinone oxidoreductase subunit I
MGYFGKIFSGIYNLLLGLWTTLKYLPGRSITIQYPKKRMEMFERFRGMVVLLSDPETGKLNCTACLLCQKACPVAAITIKQERDEETKKRFASRFDVDTLICCFCGLCEEACNFDAIKLTPKYEFATTDKASLLFNIDKLQELGRDVKYTPKKKRVVKKAASDKPAAKPVKTAEVTKQEIETSNKKPDVEAKNSDKPESPEAEK